MSFLFLPVESFTAPIMEVIHMYNKIKNRKTLFVVVELMDDAGWIISRNVQAFYNKAEAEYYAEKLKEKDDGTYYYDVEELELLELA